MIKDKNLCYWKNMYEKNRITTIIQAEYNCKSCDGSNKGCKQYVKQGYLEKMMEGR